MRLHRWGVVPLVFILLAGACHREKDAAPIARSQRVLRVAMNAGTYTLDPNLLNETTSLSILENMFESLIAQDADLKVTPGLAVGWETPDDLTWRVHLRQGVIFHDGTEMKSVDVKYSYDRVLSSDRFDFRNYLNSVDRVEIVDDYTVDIKLKQRYSVLANLGCIYVLPAAYVREHGEDYFNQHPVGTGPYRFVSWTPGATVTMAAFNRYWKGRPAFDEMTFEAIPSENDRLRGIEEGRIDIAWMIPLRREPPASYRVLLQPALHVCYLGLDNRRKKSPYVEAPTNPFLDERVRRAFLYGLDTDDVIDKVFAGHAYAATQFVTPNIFGYNPAIRRQAADRALARRLLAEAGFPRGFGLTLDLLPSRRALGEYLREAYHQIGIELKLNVMAKDLFFDKLRRHDTSAYILAWSCSSGDASELFEDSLHTEDVGGKLGAQNYAGYSSAAADALFERSVTTADPKSRLEFLQQAMEVAMRDLPWIPIYIAESSYGVAKNVRFSPRLDDHILGIDAQPSP